MIEAAIVAPIFFIFIFGILEYGMAFYARLTVQNISQTASRAASAAGDDVNADFRILTAANESRATVGTSKISHIVVYKATGPSDSVPSACLTGSVSGRCNHYTGATLVSLDVDDFKCDEMTTDLDRFWCPHTRSVVLTGSGPDYVGVYVRAIHQPITGFFGSEFVFTNDTIMRLEPRRSS